MMRLIVAVTAGRSTSRCFFSNQVGRGSELSDFVGEFWMIRLISACDAKVNDVRETLEIGFGEVGVDEEDAKEFVD
jgi:hypothetical protein